MRRSRQTEPQETAQPSAIVRCAIYTRKSTDEGLDQEFNSLDAQRESAESYIASQRGEGWIPGSRPVIPGRAPGAVTRETAQSRGRNPFSEQRPPEIVCPKTDRQGVSTSHFVSHAIASSWAGTLKLCGSS